MPHIPKRYLQISMYLNGKEKSKHSDFYSPYALDIESDGKDEVDGA